MNDQSHAIFPRIFKGIQQVVVGAEETTLLLMCSLLAGGHVLIEDVPGVGKTLLAHALAKSTSLGFSRVQCTPDILPSDILGFSLYDINTGASDFRPGAVMTNLLLVDEINRASPKTQSSLLEAMEERQATVDGVTRKLPSPFMVIATQNPIESVGTSPLPEAQLDRFMMRLSMGYPTAQQETEMLLRLWAAQPLDAVQSVLDADELLKLQALAAKVTVSTPVATYITEIARQTRTHSNVALGASPRGALSLMRAAQAMSFIRGEAFVSPDTVRTLASPVLAHRLILRSASQGRSDIRQTAIIEEIISALPVPLK